MNKAVFLIEHGNLIVDLSDNYDHPLIVDDVIGGLRLLQKMRFRLILLLSDVFSDSHTLSQNEVTENLGYIQELFFTEGIKLDSVLYSPLTPNSQLMIDEFNSPELLLTNSIRENDITLSESWLISSQPEDIILSHQLGLRPVLIDQDISEGSQSEQPELIASSMRDVAAVLAQHNYYTTYSAQYSTLN